MLTDTRCIPSERSHYIVKWVGELIIAIRSGAEVYSIKTHRRIIL